MTVCPAFSLAEHLIQVSQKDIAIGGSLDGHHCNPALDLMAPRIVIVRHAPGPRSPIGQVRCRSSAFSVYTVAGWFK
jgi:hypothetical protein